MKALLSLLLLCTAPGFAHAQAIVNMPSEAATATLTYSSINPYDGKDKGHFWGQLGPSEGNYAILMCGQAKMKAHPVVDGATRSGYFDFESPASCDKIARAMQTFDNRSVRFTLRINPAKRDANPGYEGGEVTQVEWLAAGESASEEAAPAPAPAVAKTSCWCRSIRNMSFGGGEQTGTVAVLDTCPADGGSCQHTELKTYGGHGMFGFGTGQKDCQREIADGTFSECEN